MVAVLSTMGSVGKSINLGLSFNYIKGSGLASIWNLLKRLTRLRSS